MKAFARGSARLHAVGALVGAALAAPAVLTIDPFGIYYPERRLGTLAIGAAIGALAGGALAGPFGRRDRGSTVAGLVLVLVAVMVTHTNLIALSFSLAVERRIAAVAVGAAALVLVVLGVRRTTTWPGAMVLALLPLVYVTSAHQAFFMRAPHTDCDAVARQRGITPFGSWPEHDHPELERCLLYDVVADEEAGLVVAAYIREDEGVGAGVLSVRDRAGGHWVRWDPYWNGEDRWLPNRMSIDPERRMLWVPIGTYDPDLDAWLERFRYGPGPEVELLDQTPMALDPSDSVRAGDRILVLDYPRRFDDVPSSRIAAHDADAPDRVEVGIVDEGGWMTEYMVVDDEARRVYVTDIAGHLFEIDLDTLEVVRKHWLGISTLSGALDGDRLYVAAPYRRSVVVLDRETFDVVDEYPCGDAVREVEIDRARERLYATAYGDGLVCAYDLAREGALLGRVQLGTPLRGLFVLEGSGHVLAGGGCGLVEIDPDLAF